MPNVRLVIEAEETIGKGVSGDPSRIVTCYYDLDGNLLAKRDKWESQRAVIAVRECQDKGINIDREWKNVPST